MHTAGDAGEVVFEGIRFLAVSGHVGYVWIPENIIFLSRIH
jgi:hypothetical protein